MDTDNKIFLVCTIESRYSEHFMVMITSLFMNNLNLSFKVFLVYDFIYKRDLVCIKRIFSKFKQEYELICSKLAVPIINFPLSAHASNANYYRLFITRLLPRNIKKILYLDCDIIVLGEILTLWRIELQNSYAAVCYPMHISNINLEGGTQEFNSGVMLINLEAWRKDNLEDKFIDYLEKNSAEIRFWDQDVLNAIIGSNVLKFDDRYNFTLSKRIKINALDPVIIHFVGLHKPWNYYCKHEMKELYHQYRKHAGLLPIKFKQNNEFSSIKNNIKSLVFLGLKNFRFNKFS